MQRRPPERVFYRYWTQTLSATAVVCLVPGLCAFAQLPGRVLQEEWRLGGPDAQGPTAFSAEPSVVVDRYGTLYAFGRRDSHITVFDSAGKFLRTIGRRGQGPGEFVSISGHGLVGDTLWVSNFPSAAVSTFSADGRHHATRRVIVDLAERFGAPVGISAFLSNGRAIVIPSGAMVGTDSRLHVPVLIGDREMRSVDTLLRILQPQELFVPGVGTFWYAPIAIPPRIDVASDGSGILVVDWKRDGNEAEVRRFAPDGSVSWSRTINLPSSAIDTRTRDSIINRAVQMAAGQIEAAKRRGEVPPGVSTRSLVVQSLDLPDRYPPVTDAVLGIDGTAWLRRGDRGPQQRWLVLDSSGTPLFEVRSALRLTIQEASREVVWATFSDDDGYPYLVRFRVRAAN